MKRQSRLVLMFPVVLMLAACSSPTGPRLPSDGKDPKKPPPDDTAYAPALVPADLA